MVRASPRAGASRWGPRCGVRLRAPAAAAVPLCCARPLPVPLAGTPWSSTASRRKAASASPSRQ
eukprot:9963223-Alexandrium_andersonii.AAC.1